MQFSAAEFFLKCVREIYRAHYGELGTHCQFSHCALRIVSCRIVQFSAAEFFLKCVREIYRAHYGELGTPRQQMLGQ